MKQFRKRTIALVLASVVTVVGAFGAENYKNSLMSLEFDGNSGGAVNLTLHTKRDYSGTINPIKKDASTYVIMLPETNSQMAASPQISGNIESVDIKTMPYTTNSKGYTKITIKTAPNTLISAKKTIYIPSNSTSEVKQTEETPLAERIQEPQRNYNPNYTAENTNYKQERTSNTIHSASGVDQTSPVDIRKSIKQFEQQPPVNEQKPSAVELNPETKNVAASSTSSEQSSETLIIVLSIFLVLVLVIYFYIKGKNKMAEVLGEQTDFNIDDEQPKQNKTKEKKEKKREKIRKTINHLDKMYSKPSSIPQVPKDVPLEVLSADTDANIEDTIVDLDELFQEKISQSTEEENQEENSALDEFLSAYSFDIEEDAEPEKEFDEDLYDKFINDENLKFAEEDIEKINLLLNTEINDDTFKNLKEFAPVVSKPEKKPTHKEILENFVTSYTINQNLTFTSEDVNALYKIISVEIDKDFITDLRTNPQRAKEMQLEIEKRKVQTHKSSELLTLNVKDMLPDLSAVLKQQGGKKIESEYKPQAVYFEKGYEVNTLDINDELPDLTIEINNKNAYVSRPSDEIQYADVSYDVDKINLGSDFDDLSDIFEHPEKYEKQEVKKVVVDEEALLKNISNVTFKPFYDGNEEDEIINDFDNDTIPSMQDIQDEFSQIGENFEIIQEDLTKKTTETEIIAGKETIEEKIESNKLTEFVESHKNLKSKIRSDENAEKLLKIIENQKEQRINKELQTAEVKPKIPEINTTKSTKEEQPATSDLQTCYINDEIFDIVSKVEFSKQIKCYLAKNENGYTVLSYVNGTIEKLKHYNNLKTENMQARVSEKIDDKTSRYIVRIGTHKFILNVSDSNLEFMLDLC